MKNYVDLRSFGEHASDAKRILKLLQVHGKAKTKNTDLSRLFGMKAKEIIDSGLLDIATTSYRNGKKKSLYQTDYDVTIEPSGFRWYFKRNYQE